MTNATLLGFRSMAHAMTEPESVSTEWPNHCGWDVTRASERFEVWCHGGVSKVVDDPSSPCGFRRTHYAIHRSRVGCGVEARVAVMECVARNQWHECE